MKKILYTLILVLLLGGCTPPNQGEVEETRFLLDTVCTIRTKGRDADEAMDAAFKRIEEVGKYVNYFDENSTVNKFNISEADIPVSLDRDTCEILKISLLISEKSNGAYDPTVATVNDLWDFKSGNAKPPTASEVGKNLKTVGYENLVFDPENSTLSKKKEGVRIDLGGSAKGYAADCAAEVLAAFNVDYAIINLGGNVKVLGKNPRRPDGSWQIGIQTPFAKSGAYDQTVSVHNSSVVTSGTYQRYFEFENNLYHHILDPKTGYPVKSEYDGVTIVTPSALLADCLSTACMVLGKTEATALAEEFDSKIYFSYRVRN